MSISVERLINLALYLDAARGPVTAVQVRSEVFGYPPDQEEAAFLRMFERDKDDLRRMGLVITSDESGAYALDKSSTFASPVELSPVEVAAVRVAAAALLADPSYPYADDLRIALAKLTAEAEAPESGARALLADEAPHEQGATVALLSNAASACKRVSFDYTNSQGVSAPHEIEPFGLFLHDGRWYAVGRDTAIDEIRTYTVSRMRAAEPNRQRPRTPDFERPADFRVSSFRRLPFQYGAPEDAIQALVRIDASTAWRARAMASGQGTLRESPDGGTEWSVEVRSMPRFVRFVLEHGPGISIVSPQEAVSLQESGLRRVAETHG